jgi:tRNA-dihydrouridine synthase
MAHPALVAECVKAMRDAVSIPVTVKHRIGINGRDSYAQLCDFVGTVRDAGCKVLPCMRGLRFWRACRRKKPRYSAVAL